MKEENKNKKMISLVGRLIQTGKQERKENKHYRLVNKLKNYKFSYIKYTDYLKTEQWRHTKVRFYKLEKNNYCYCCGITEDLQVHHKTYKNFRHENINDLVCLCKECYKKVHDIIDNNSSDLLNAHILLKKIISNIK